MTLPPPPPPPPRPLPKLPHPLLDSSPDLLLLFAATLSFLFLLKSPFSPSPSPSPPRRRLFPSSRMTNRPLSFSSPASLSSFLAPRLPSHSLSSWGLAAGSKTLHNLFLELSLGESLLEPPPSPSSPPVRTLHVASLLIKNPQGARLLESHQLLSDGSLRPRRRPLSEKMKPGESVEDAAVRAVREELGGGVTVRVLMGTYEVRVEERVSASYPGLPARYVMHSVEVEVGGLPEDGEFETEEGGEGGEEEEKEGKAVFVKRHFWKWVYDDDGDDRRDGDGTGSVSQF